MEEFCDNKILEEAKYNFNINSIYDEEETDNIILSIRENIMDNVMKEIDHIDETTRTIAFIVEIGCDAMWKMLNIEFTQHNALPNLNSPGWKGDSCMEPSERDTLAANSIPIAPKSMPEEEADEYEPKLVCDCRLGIPCECRMPPEKRNKAQKRLLDETLVISREDTPEEEEEEYSIDEEERVEQLTESNPKLPSSICDDGLQSSGSVVLSEPSSEDLGVKCVFSNGFSKLQDKKKQVSLPKLNVTEPKRATRISAWMELPAIRTAVKTDYRTVEPEVKTKKKF